MDHLFANSDKPVPDPSTQTLPSGSVENVDEDDENAAATHIKKMGTASEADLVPRVRQPFQHDGGLIKE